MSYFHKVSGLSILAVLVLASCGKENQRPVASFTANPTIGTAPLLVTVNGASSSDSDGTIASYTWNWGDNSTNTSGVTSTHTYTTAGNYTITLSVTDDKGLTSSNVAVQNITVQAQPDTTRPTILAVSPTNGQSGVQNNASIVFTFSEPMNRAATEQAYRGISPGIQSPNEVRMSWNSTGTVLTITPDVDRNPDTANELIYNTGPDLTTQARVYEFEMRNIATDLAGNVIRLTPTPTDPDPASQRYNFKTLREITYTFTSIPELDGDILGVAPAGIVDTTSPVMWVGDSAGNVQQKSFVSFNISALPASVTVSRANLSVFQSGIVGNPYGELGNVLIDHISFAGPLTLASAFNTQAIASYGNLSVNSTISGKNADVTAAVQNDYLNRVTRSNLSQYRLFIAIGTDGDNSQDVAVFNTANAATNKPQLAVSFLIP